MNAVVIVLWRPGDPWREWLWEFAKARWETTGLRVLEADDSRGLFAARNTGARAAGDWDAALFADADIILADPAQARKALELAAPDGYVAAYKHLVTLTQPATAQVLCGVDPTRVQFTRRYARVWIGAIAIGRQLFDEIGGYDERFAPFPGQDVAIVHAAATLGRMGRVPGLACHLWHDRGGSQPGHPSGAHPTLWRRYTAASGNRALMRELLAR